MDLPNNPIDELFPVIADAVTQWKQANTPEFIHKKVIDQLDKTSHEVTLKLLGFKDTWGTWELDHCNGRSGNSPAGDYLKQAQQKAIESWLSSVCMPELAPATLKKLKKDMQYEYTEKLTYELRNAVKQKASSDAKLLIDALCKETSFTKYTRLIELINSESK